MKGLDRTKMVMKLVMLDNNWKVAGVSPILGIMHELFFHGI